MGLTGYYRRFVQHYGIIAKPLTALLQKNNFHWTAAAEAAFQQLKEALIQIPTLALPNFSQPFIVETDACHSGVGAVLLQGKQPLAFLSKALPPTKLGLSTYEKELWALIFAINKWRYYLYGRPFTIRTDHQSLKFLLDQRLTTFLQQKWLSKLLGYDYVITYKKGSQNIAADALSRAFEGSTECAATSLLEPLWFKQLTLSWESDISAQTLISKLVITPSSLPEYSFHQQILRFQGRIYVGSNGSLRFTIWQELHASGVGGHSGLKATLKRITQYFFGIR